MAGSGRRVFAPGEVLTASNTMNYLMDQTVMNFAGTAARGSAIGTAVAEGMVSYLADTNEIEVYDGADWQQVYPSVANTGEVVQVVTNSIQASQTVTNTTFTDTSLTATITPKSILNKIYVIVHFTFDISGTNPQGFATIFRGNSATGTNLGNGNNGLADCFSSSGIRTVVSMTAHDSPATTSATTYTAAIRRNAGTNVTIAPSSEKCVITLLEVVG